MRSHSPGLPGPDLAMLAHSKRMKLHIGQMAGRNALPCFFISLHLPSLRQ